MFILFLYILQGLVARWIEPLLGSQAAGGNPAVSLRCLRFSASFFTSQSPGALSHRMWMLWRAVVEFLCNVPGHIIGFQIRVAMTNVIQWRVSHQLKSLSNFWERGRPVRRKWAAVHGVPKSRKWLSTHSWKGCSGGGDAWLEYCVLNMEGLGAGNEGRIKDTLTQATGRMMFPLIVMS